MLLTILCLLFGCVSETTTETMEPPIFDYKFSTCTGEDAFKFKQKTPSLKIIEEKASFSYKISNYCGSNFSARLQPEKDSLKIMITNDATIAKCMCVYNVNMTIVESALADFGKIEIWLTNTKTTDIEPQKITEIELV